MKFKVTLVSFDIFSHQKTENGWLVSNIIPLSMKICKLIKWKKKFRKIYTLEKDIKYFICGFVSSDSIVFNRFVLLLQELRSREEELTKAALQQKLQEEFLKKREQELAEREIDLLERELNIMILQQIMNKPTPKKRKGKFKKNRLNKQRSGGKTISEPSGKWALPLPACQW